MRAPGVTPADAFQAHPGAAQHTPFLYGLDHVMRAGGLIATGGAEQGRKRPLVQSDGQDKEFFEQLVHFSVILYATQFDSGIFDDGRWTIDIFD